MSESFMLVMFIRFPFWFADMKGGFCDIAPIQNHSFKKRIQRLEKSRRCIILKLDFESAEVFYVYQTFS